MGSCMANPIYIACLLGLQDSTSGSSMLSRLVVSVGIKQNAKCCYAKYTAKRTCKIVDFPRNCEMETVATCTTTDGNGSCHGLKPLFFDDMTGCRMPT